MLHSGIANSIIVQVQHNPKYGSQGDGRSRAANKI